MLRNRRGRDRDKRQVVLCATWILIFCNFFFFFLFSPLSHNHTCEKSSVDPKLVLAFLKDLIVFFSIFLFFTLHVYHISGGFSYGVEERVQWHRFLRGVFFLKKKNPFTFLVFL